MPKLQSDKFSGISQTQIMTNVGCRQNSENVEISGPYPFMSGVI